MLAHVYSLGFQGMLTVTKPNIINYNKHINITTATIRTTLNNVIIIITLARTNRITIAILIIKENKQLDILQFNT